MAIYEANKEIIGDNPSLIRAGQVLQIPSLPA
jgi:nucleoid-associated protein YgaU